MVFRSQDFNIEAWLRMEVENVLQKVCSLYDTEGRLVERYQTRISVVPVGNFRPDSTVKSISAPSLYRAFFYDETGAQIARIPEMREWTQACEDAAHGGASVPIDPSLVPHGLAIAPTLIHYEEDLAVASAANIKIMSYTVPVGKTSYARNIRMSGDNRGIYTIFKNLTKLREARTWWTKFDVETFFGSSDGGLLLEEGDKIEVFVLNKGSTVAKFTSSMSFVNT